MLRRHFWTSVVAALLGFFLLSVVVIHQVEGKLDPSLTRFDAFRIVLVFFLGEYGDTPQTEIGKALSIILFILGIVVVAAFIGKIASIFVEMNMEVNMPNGMEKHIVICNWHQLGDRIVKELHSQLAAPETDIIIITEEDVNEPELRMSPEYEKVFFIRSDPTLHAVLRRARAQYAKSVILLADRHCSDPDAKTALISLAITKLERNLPRKPHIIAEVINHNKIQHLVDAGVDEWVCSANYGLGIIAQSALYGKLSDVYQQLLTYSSDTNEIYLVDELKYPKSFLGQSFQDVAKRLNAGRQTENPTILVGVKRENRVLLNPKADEFDCVRSGDSLIVMSFDQPDLRSLEA